MFPFVAFTFPHNFLFFEGEGAVHVDVPTKYLTNINTILVCLHVFIPNFMITIALQKKLTFKALYRT